MKITVRISMALNVRATSVPLDLIQLLERNVGVKFASYQRMKIRILACLILIQLQVDANPSVQPLPNSVNIVTGIPLTIPEMHLGSMGLTPEKNTGGWGDVMSNVTMAIELKKQFPQVQVRLIVTLNDQDTRPFVNKVSKFIPQVLKNEKGQPYLNPELKTVQHYQGIEVYFAHTDGATSMSVPANLKKEQIIEIEKSVEHIPRADMGLQYSANNSPFSNLIAKADQMHVYFEEYSHNRTSHAFSFFQQDVPQIKLFAGPLGFGVYGFGSSDDSAGSKKNQELIQSWLSQRGITQNLSQMDLAFAYAGDPEMIADYVSAVEGIGKKKKRTTVIVYKGSGPVEITGHIIKVPMSVHPKELGHAMIAESTYSPLVTGDGSVSSAMETTRPNKTFLYENTSWKVQAMTTLFQVIFKGKSDLLEKSADLLITETQNLKQAKLTRAKRVKMIRTALLDDGLNTQIHQFLKQRQKAFNIADNTMNLFQYLGLFKTLSAGFKKGLMFSDSYLIWLVDLSKKFEARTGLPVQLLTAQLNDQVYGKSFQLIEKWFSIFTLWELEKSVKASDVVRVVNETADFLEQRDTNTKFLNEMVLYEALNQINASVKSRSALYQALLTDKSAYARFNLIREKYNEQSQKKLLLSRQKTCRQAVSN